eukprot:TRINITY_DN4354_c0_g1_i1.p1 TRINITY_DN4354_c0_g1~~TRINITY_DN4354_c0_g1_i1.p1  ORF type:complete len:391 (-),score=89.55 TRINITY_DN4354_c0_g1_i1:353-1525(-)
MSLTERTVTEEELGALITEKDVFDWVRRKFPRDQSPLLHRGIDEWAVEQPLAGLRVLHNLPLFFATLLTIEHVHVGGAEVVCTKPNFVESDPKTISLLERTSLTYIPTHQEVVDKEKEEGAKGYDLVLDCCGEFAGLIQPRLGFVELTRTGDLVWEQRDEISSSVMSVDNSTVKRIEDAFGSADGFMRAFNQFTNPEESVGKSFIIFGYGKVGRGVAHRLTQDFKAKVSVVDVTDECLESASRRGFSAFKISDPALHDVIRNCYAIVTCSGVEGLISKSFGTREEVRQLFLKKPKHLSNIGALDEWGGAFDPEDVIFGKRAVNFSLEEPTTIKFLDPAFFARDLAALYLLPTHESKLYTKNGLHPLPDAVNDSVLNDWCNFHNCQLPDLS